MMLIDFFSTQEISAGFYPDFSVLLSRETLKNEETLGNLLVFLLLLSIDSS